MKTNGVKSRIRGVAQVVEYTSGGRVVAGSSPVTPTFLFFDFVVQESACNLSPEGGNTSGRFLLAALSKIGSGWLLF